MNHFTTTVLACGIMLAVLPTARADTTCPPNLVNTTVNGNLIVPANQTGSILAGVTVTGNVQVQTNAGLVLLELFLPSTIVGNVSVGTGASVDASVGGLTIDGNLDANQCLFVTLNEGVAVGGNVQIQYCTAASNLVADDIGGNVACNNSSACDVSANKVNGNAEVNDNSSTQVDNNTIANNLEYQGNTSITDGGFPNTVGGKKTGQCAGF
jgi:hypothetical protein